MSEVRVERHVRSPHRVKSFEPGDCVQVRFNHLMDGGFDGFVIHASPAFLRMKVHGGVGRLSIEHEGVPVEATECINWDVDIPMTSVAWIRHLEARPVSCKCREDLP